MIQQEQHGRKRREYLVTTERQRENSHNWYMKNKEYALAKSAATRQRLREEALKSMPSVIKPSIESIERDLPVAMQKNIKRLRAEFLKIPILERPPYDVWIELKKIEHQKDIIT